MSVASETFAKNVPTITQDDAVDAAKKKRVVQSFHAHPISTERGGIDALTIKWKLGDGTTETMLIGRYAALVLRMMLSHLEDNNWTELAIIPPDAKPRQ
jgi:hypothetical protein